MISIRPIEHQDDPRMERIILEVMGEYGAIGAGFSSSDPEVKAMSQAYPGPDHAYFVVADEAGRILGGAGVAPLAGGEPGVCELRKMYLLREGRGRGLGKQLFDACIVFARQAGFRRCYLETLDTMTTAMTFYRRQGFTDLPVRMGRTGHGGCNRQMIRAL